MIKKELYPKTQRVKVHNSVIITEKLDGSNLGLFRKGSELWVATRSVMFPLSMLDYEEVKVNIKNYKGLYAWLKEHGKQLVKDLYDGSGLFGEWMGSAGHVAYPNGFRSHDVYMFAKARLEEDEAGFHATHIMYDHDLFGYIFEDGEMKDYIKTVPIVARMDQVPSLEELNELYGTYTKVVNRNVEGFVVNFYDNVRKYVRMKTGKLEDHHE